MTPRTGFHAEVYQKTGTGEYTIAFTGSENGQDVLADLALGKKQWEDNRDNVLAAIAALPNATSIIFTGHSLGGGPAQYGIYDYLKGAKDQGKIPLPVSLITFNSFGGIAGLQQMYSDFNPAIAAQITDAAHVFTSSSGRQDPVAQQGAGHFGGNTYELVLAPGLGLPQLHSPWQAFKTLTLPAAASAPQYMNIPGAQGIAAVFGYLGDDGIIDNREGWARAGAGVLLALAAAPAYEVDQVLDVLLPGAGAVNWGFLRDASPALRIGVGLTAIGAISVINVAEFLSQANETALKALWTAKQIADAAYTVALEAGSSTLLAIARGINEHTTAYALNMARDRQPPTSVAINPPTFDLTVDPIALKPIDSTALGTSTGGQGLLGAGAGYQYTMPSADVNQNGLPHTAGSGMSTDFVRPGNHSLANTDNLINALRSQADAWRESQRPLGGALTATSVPVGFDPTRSEVLTLAARYSGDPLQARVYYAEDGTPLGIQSLETRSVRILPGGTGEFQSGQYYTFDRVSSSPGVEFFGMPQASDLAPVVVIRKAAETDPYTDPLTLDADSDGVRLSASPVYFDLNADGTPEPLPWTAPTDPLLVLDLNRDGRINNGRELVDLTDADAPLNLRSMDENSDGVLDANDAAYWQLQLWQDRNQDGYASAEERQGLSERASSPSTSGSGTQSSLRRP